MRIIQRAGRILRVSGDAIEYFLGRKEINIEIDEFDKTLYREIKYY